jgi:hypothetical protein
MITDSLYHGVLRIALLVCAFALVFDSGLVTPVTKQLSDGALNYLATAAVGVFVGVEPNELNTLTAELSAREQELAAREAALREREIATRDFGIGDSSDYSTYILSVILFVLTSLIVLNYALDWNRARKQGTFA